MNFLIDQSMGHLFSTFVYVTLYDVSSIFFVNANVKLWVSDNIHPSYITDTSVK